MAQDFEDVAPTVQAAPAGPSSSGGDTATNQGDPISNVDIARGPSLGGDVTSATIDMAGPGGVAAATGVAGNPLLDEERAPTTAAVANPAVTDQPGQPPIDTMNSTATAVTDGIVTQGAGQIADTAAPVLGGIAGRAATSAGSSSDDDTGTKEEKKTKDINDYPLDSPEVPPPGVNRLLKDGVEYSKVEANAQVIENPNAQEMGTLNEVRMVQGEILAAQKEGFTIDTSVIKIGEGQLAAGVAELEIARQVDEQKKAQEAQAERDKIEAEKVAKETAAMADAMITQMLIASENWTQSLDGVGRPIREVNGAQGNGQGPGTHSPGGHGHIAKESPLHKDNLPKMPSGVNGAEVSSLLAFVNPGSLQTPGYGALGTGTNHGLGGTGLGQTQDGPTV